jgi:aminoglycoside 2'-N-acetyltransferase I
MPRSEYVGEFPIRDTRIGLLKNEPATSIRTVRLIPTDALSPVEQAAIRALLDAAFAGAFTDDDWTHALGGTHAIVEAGDAALAHASVVPRLLDVGRQRLRTGYVEAVAVLPTVHGTGLGTAVMRALSEIIEREFELGVLSTGEWHFYERLGWERWRGPTWVRHPHGGLDRSPDDDDSLMILRTPASPPIDLFAPLTCDARPGDAW